jgi:hypothetical protein
MSSLKRKPAAGGYQDSSDLDEEVLAQIPLGQSENKKARPSPYASNRPTVLSKGTASGFQFPRLSVSARGSVPPALTVSSQYVTTTLGLEPARSRSASSTIMFGSRFTTPLQFPSEGKYNYIQITLLD